MTFEDLKKATEGIDLESENVSLGRPANRAESLSCYQEGGEWVMVEVDDRQHEYTRRGAEEDIMRKMYAQIRLRTKVR